MKVEVSGPCNVYYINPEFEAIMNREKLILALGDLLQRIARGQEYPDAHSAVAIAHKVDGDALRDAYDSISALPPELQRLANTIAGAMTTMPPEQRKEFRENMMNLAKSAEAAAHEMLGHDGDTDSEGGID